MELGGTLIVAALVLISLWLLSGKSRARRPLPPGPAGLPVIGNLLQLDKRAPFRSLLKDTPGDPRPISELHHVFLGLECLVESDEGFFISHDLSESYGPVMTVYLGPQRVVVLLGYDTVKEALVDHGDDFSGRAPIPFIVRLTSGYGLAISNGERWRQLRRFTLMTLRDFGMGRKGMEEWIQEESKHLVPRMETTKALQYLLLADGMATRSSPHHLCQKG